MAPHTFFGGLSDETKAPGGVESSFPSFVSFLSSSGLAKFSSLSFGPEGFSPPENDRGERPSG